MTVYVALLRAINVGGTGKLAMKDLAALCTGLGFSNVRTYIQSGNVVFESRKAEEAVRKAFEAALTEVLGKPADVAVRMAAEMAMVAVSNPFMGAPAAKVGIAFFNRPLPKSASREIVIRGEEVVGIGPRVVYIYFPDGMGRSKLDLPKHWGPATIRNMNTVARLTAMAVAG